MLCICYNISSISIMNFTDIIKKKLILYFFIDIFKFMVLFSIGALV